MGPAPCTNNILPSPNLTELAVFRGVMDVNKDFSPLMHFPAPQSMCHRIFFPSTKGRELGCVHVNKIMVGLSRQELLARAEMDFSKLDRAAAMEARVGSLCCLGLPPLGLAAEAVDECLEE